MKLCGNCKHYKLSTGAPPCSTCITNEDRTNWEPNTKTKREQPFKSKNRRTVYSYAKHITEIALKDQEIAARDKVISGQRETIKEDMLYASNLNGEINDLKQDLAITKRELKQSEQESKMKTICLSNGVKENERLNKIIDAIIKD